MGYRSDVVLALSAPARTAILINQIKSLPSVFQKWASVKELEDRSLIYAIKDIKWYDGFPDIEEAKAFIHELHTLNRDDPDCFYAFVRLGEETHDFQEQGQPWMFDIYLEQSINY